MQSPDFVGAVSKWLGVVYLALVAGLACDALQRAHIPRRTAWVWMAGGLITAVLSIFLIVGLEFRNPYASLHVAGQAGLPALLALAGLCGWLVFRGARCARKPDGIAGGMLLAFATAFLYSVLTGSFENARHVWVLMGLLAGSCMACVRNAVPPACVNAQRATP